MNTKPTLRLSTENVAALRKAPYVFRALLGEALATALFVLDGMEPGAFKEAFGEYDPDDPVTRALRAYTGTCTCRCAPLGKTR